MTEYKICKYLIPIQLPPEQEWMLKAARDAISERMKAWYTMQDEISVLVLCGYPPEIAEKALRAMPMDAKTFIGIFGPLWRQEK